MSTRFFCLAALAFLTAAVTPAANLTIDNFAVGQPIQFASDAFVPVNNSASGGATDIIGGDRNIEVTRTSGDLPGMTAVNSGHFIFGLLDGNGYSRIIWDGDTDNLLSFGLGSADLTLGGSASARFRIHARSDIAGSAHLTVFTSATSYSSITFLLPANGFGVTPFTEFNLAFSSLVQGAPSLVQNSLAIGVATSMASMSNINAITLFIDGTAPGSAALDAQIDFIQVSDVPEPATYALMAGGLFSLFALRRKRA